MKTKVCSKCKIEKPIEEFHKDKCKSGGIQGQCKKCRCEDGRKYHWKHKDKNNKYSKNYHQKHRYEQNKKCSENYQKNKKERLQKQKKYYKTHKEERLKYMKEIYYPIHKEDCLTYLEKWRNDNRQKISAGLKRYRQTENGKLADAKKHSKRKRNLGFKLIIPNILDEVVAYHHIDNEHVIPIPKDLHELYSCNDTQRHRENLKPIIEQLYETKF
jgi:hypothetical protein